MSIEEEIKKRLNNPENDFPTNLLYGIQLWKSKSFYYLAKYEIVTNFFSSNLLEFYKSIRKHSKDDFNEKWTIVNEFLSLDCPLGALSKSQHTNITEIIPKVASKSLKRPKRKILDSFMIIALNQRYKNFHKYDIENYGILMKDCLKYYKAILQQSLNISKDEEENQTKSILNDLNLYVKVGSNVEEMRDRFYKSIIIDLSEVVLVLKSLNIYVFDDLISILKELYFSEGKSSDYYRIEKDKSHLFMGRFDVAAVPVHILAILIEGYVAAYKSSKADLMNFTKYLFTSIFVDVETSTLKSITDIFSIISAYFRILKKYFVKIEQILLQEYDFMRLIPMKVQEMFDRYKTNSDVLCGIFSLISTIIDYNPLILEKEIINMVIQFMFIQKNGELSMELYQNMILSTIDLFTKLNRKEQFRTELFSKLDDFFDANNSSKLISDLKLSTLKRTHTDELTVASKKLKLDNMDDSSSITVDIFEKEPLDYMKLLTKTGKEEISSKSESSHNELFDEWTGIAFAWPDKNGKLKSSMINYIASQRSKMNFNFLYNLRENLTELLPYLIKDQHESYFFKLDLFCCFLCYFFNGNAMVEQSNLYWDKLQAEMDKFDECMTNFGQIIVKTNCDRIICAFLKLAYSYENFKMVVYYYHPDSIQNVNIKRPNSYLTGKDWQIIETKSNTNKKEWNRLKVARLRFSEMFENTQHSLNELDSFENLKHVLLDKATNYWLIKQLTNDQKIQVSHEILDNFTDKEAILFIIRKLFNDQEFVSIFIVAIFEKLSKLIENSSIGKLNFADCYTMNEDVVLKKVSKLIKKRYDFVVEDENSSKIENILIVLAGIQINEMKAEYKNVIIGLGFLLLFDLKANENGQLTKKLKNILMVQIKFGKFPDICKYLTADVILQIFSPIDGQNKEFVQCFFQQIIFHMTRNSMDMQTNILAKFKVDKNPNLFKLVITSSEYLVKVNSSYLKEVTKEEIKELVDEYMQAIIEFTEENANHPSDECLYGLTLVVRHLKNHNMEFSESIQQNFEKYLNYSLSNSSVWTSIFLTNALNYESQFKLSEDKIVEIIENRWEEFKYLITKDLNDGTANDDSESVLRILNIDPLKSIANFIINNQTDAQLEERFKSIESSAKANRSSSNLKHVLRIYTTLIKKGLGKKTSKTNSVITKSIELIISEVIQPLTINSKFSDDPSCLHEILDFFDGVIQNSKIQLTPKTMDKIMEFVENINIKKHKIVNGEEKLFFKLNQQISSILYDFIVNKDFYVLNRLSQYFHVFNGVLSSIIGYKNDRNEQETLESFEILSLSDLLHPMEKIMNILVKYEKDLKLVAPYELVSIITFIITSKRSTTLHDMIKKSINNICYELISIYDKHAPAYILRTCGEAEKNIYTEMVKNYGKYKLFKGKI